MAVSISILFLFVPMHIFINISRAVQQSYVYECYREDVCSYIYSIQEILNIAYQS